MWFTTPSRRATVVFGTFSLLFLLSWLGCQGAIESATGPEEEQVTRSLAQVVLVPAGATLSPGQTQQFRAFGRLSEGDSVGVAVAFSATGGSITPEGLYTAGGTPGNYDVVVQEAGGALSDTSGVTIRGGGSTTDIYSWSFEALGGPRNDRYGFFKNGFTDPAPPDRNDLIQNGAPDGAWFMQSFNQRTSSLWPPMYLEFSDVGAASYDELYVRFAVRIQGGWANEGFKTLRFYDDGFNSTGWLAIERSGKLHWTFTIVGGTATYYSTSALELNRWYVIETQFNANPGGRASVKIWLDGQLAIDEIDPNTNGSGRANSFLAIPASGPDQGSAVDMWGQWDNIQVSTQRIGG